MPSFGLTALGRLLLVAGAVLAAAGILLILAGSLLPQGHLPGDIVWRGRRVTVVFPLATSIVLSLVLTLILNLLLRR